MNLSQPHVYETPLNQMKVYNTKQAGYLDSNILCSSRAVLLSSYRRFEAILCLDHQGWGNIFKANACVFK